MPGLLIEIGKGERAGASAAIIACFDDTGLDAARALSGIPVIGICEAAVATAALLSKRFTVVTTLERSRVPVEELCRRYGMAERAKVRAANIAVLSLEDPNSGARDRLRSEIAAAMDEDKAEAIVLGCAGMADLARTLQSEFGIPVIDGVGAAVKQAEALIGLGLRTSKRGAYATPIIKPYAGAMSEFPRHAMRTIRTLRPDEIGTLVHWVAGEGWNPGIGDAAAFFAADPEGFLGAFADGEMVAGISAVAYGQSFGFIGLYICRPDRRGQGHGRAVWDAGMARLAGRTIGLDGVPEQQANYERMGFVRTYETVRLTGIVREAAAEGLVPCSVEMLPTLVEYDRHCFPGPREAFLAAWLSPSRIALAAISDGRLQGYGVVRPCLSGHKIGPLLADTPEIAGALLGRLGAVASGPVSLDVPALSIPALEPYLENVTSGFSTARMYHGPAPAIRMERVFASSTLELG